MVRVLSVSVVVLLLAGAAVYAVPPPVDTQPPPWRGEWPTTYQYWEFLDDNAGGVPWVTGTGLKPDGPGPLDEGPPYIPGYLDNTELWVEPFELWIDLDPASNREGIWPLSGTIDVVVDNHEPPNEKKIVWLQVIWAERILGDHPDVPIITPIPLVDHITTAPLLVGNEHVPLGDDWFESTYTWEIYPNPIDEQFTIGGDILVDQLIIDTWCIPEPATLAVLLIGGLLLLGRLRLPRRKRST